MEKIQYLNMTLQQLMQCPAATVHEIMEAMDKDLLIYKENFQLDANGQTSFGMNLDAMKVQASQISFLRKMLECHHKNLVDSQINKPGSMIISPEFQFV